MKPEIELQLFPLLNGADWADIASKLRRSELQNPDIWLSFDPPTRTAVKKFERLLFDGNQKFDSRRGPLSAGNLTCVTWERLVLAAETLYCGNEPPSPLSVLTATGRCASCKKKFFVGALVMPLADSIRIDGKEYFF